MRSLKNDFCLCYENRNNTIWSLHKQGHWPNIVSLDDELIFQYEVLNMIFVFVNRNRNSPI